MSALTETFTEQLFANYEASAKFSAIEMLLPTMAC